MCKVIVASVSTLTPLLLIHRERWKKKSLLTDKEDEELLVFIGNESIHLQESMN